jgi:hypothetical protein
MLAFAWPLVLRWLRNIFFTLAMNFQTCKKFELRVVIDDYLKCSGVNITAAHEADPGAHDVQREMGYINQATPTLMTTNSANDHSMYLIQFDAVRCVRHASAMETNRANETMMPK